MSHSGSAAIDHASAASFELTLERVTSAIEAAGMTIFARIDHAAGARSVGLEMPPAVVILYGHPKGGTPIMQACPLAALDLPLRALVREAPDGQVFLSFHPVEEMLREAGVPAELAARLRPAQHLLLDAIRWEPFGP
jgi:uncharacterized protein (DUF302 family)